MSFVDFLQNTPLPKGDVTLNDIDVIYSGYYSRQYTDKVKLLVADGNNLAIFNALWKLHSDETYRRTLIARLPLASEQKDGLLSTFATDEKRDNFVRTRIKVYRFLMRVMADVDPNFMNTVPEKNLEHIRKLAFDVNSWYVRLYDRRNYDGWEDAYCLPDGASFSSCMSNLEYDCANFDTWRCYLTDYYGVPDDGYSVKLAVLYQQHDVVARAITFEQGGSLYYVRNYGDDRLIDWLEHNGYEPTDRYPTGMRLVADIDVQESMLGTQLEGFSFAAFHPFVDGLTCCGHLVQDSDTDTVYWELMDLPDHKDNSFDDTIWASLSGTGGYIPVGKCKVTDKLTENGCEFMELVTNTVTGDKNIVIRRNFTHPRVWKSSKDYNYVRISTYFNRPMLVHIDELIKEREAGNLWLLSHDSPQYAQTDGFPIYVDKQDLQYKDLVVDEFGFAIERKFLKD